jgi:BirA family biotin operon repressor/biotin-[acetyl-CoA-carboxylase] ligase
LRSDPPDLSRAVAPPADLADALAASRAGRGALGSALFYFETIGSTNDLAARLAGSGAAEGTTVVAEAQREGRGRLGRTWFSPQGAGLYVSIVLRPGRTEADTGDAGAPPARLALPSALTLAAGVALAEAVRDTTGLAVEIKWPNDLLFQRRKLAGILAEASVRDGAIEYVVLGFGVNVRAAVYPPDVVGRATSIEGELGRPVDRGLILAGALVRLAGCLQLLRCGAMADVLARWRALSPSALGSRVEWRAPAGTVGGRTAGIDADGALLVERDGRVDRVVAGEVIWL